MGWLKKLKTPKIMWTERKLCFFYNKRNEIVQEWIAVDVGAAYIVCEIMGLQVCYQVPKPFVKLFMKEKKLDDTELSCN